MLREAEVLDMLADWIGEQVSCSVGLMQRQQEAARALALEVAQAHKEMAPVSHVLEWRDAPSAFGSLAQWPAVAVRVHLGLCATWCEFLAKQPVLFAECFAGSALAPVAVEPGVAVADASPAEAVAVVKPKGGARRGRKVVKD